MTYGELDNIGNYNHTRMFSQADRWNIWAPGELVKLFPNSAGISQVPEQLSHYVQKQISLGKR